MSSLAEVLLAKLRVDGKEPLRIAVFAFSDNDGKTCALGSVAADQLSLKLFDSGKVRIVERERLEGVLKEQKFSSGEKVDLDTAARLGRLAGASAVILGRITPAGDSLDISARIVAVESAELLSIGTSKAALASAAKYGKCGAGGSAVEGRSGVPTSSELTSANPSGLLFREDFSKIGTGNAPTGWMGTDHYAVKVDTRGKHLFACMDNGPKRFTLPVAVPESSFKIDVVASADWQYWQIVFEIGTLQAGFKGRYSAFINAAQQRGKELPSDSPVTFSLTKDGAIFRLFADGAEVLVGRYPSVRLAPTVILDLGDRDCTQGSPRIYRIDVTGPDATGTVKTAASNGSNGPSP